MFLPSILFCTHEEGPFQVFAKDEFSPLLQPLYIETHPVSTLTWESSELAPQVVLIGVWFLFITIQTGFSVVLPVQALCLRTYDVVVDIKLNMNQVLLEFFIREIIIGAFWCKHFLIPAHINFIYVLAVTLNISASCLGSTAACIRSGHVLVTGLSVELSYKVAYYTHCSTPHVTALQALKSLHTCTLDSSPWPHLLYVACIEWSCGRLSSLVFQGPLQVYWGTTHNGNVVTQQLQLQLQKESNQQLSEHRNWGGYPVEKEFRRYNTYTVWLHMLLL